MAESVLPNISDPAAIFFKHCQRYEISGENISEKMFAMNNFFTIFALPFGMV